jgi:hypothetical protein
MQASETVIGFRMDALTVNFVVLFFAGAFLCNSVPHVVSGLQGVPFPTPFAKPRGVGKSPPVVNFLWGFLNLLLGLFLLGEQPVSVGVNPQFATVLIGALAFGIYLSRHFGKVWRGS